MAQNKKETFSTVVFKKIRWVLCGKERCVFISSCITMYHNSHLYMYLYRFYHFFHDVNLLLKSFPLVALPRCSNGHNKVYEMENIRMYLRQVFHFSFKFLINLIICSSPQIQYFTDLFGFVCLSGHRCSF